MKRDIRLTKKGLKSLLSPLEADVLSALWKKDEMHVRHIHSRVRKKGIALTSVAVALDRLYKKKLVTRKMKSCRGGYRYIYSATKDRSEIERSIVEDSVQKLIDNFGSVAVSYFNEKFSKKRGK
jgi:predicted transcriptional regulator